MASIKELKLKIGSLRNTNKITSAMKMVSSSKLRRSQEAMQNYQAYSTKLTEIVNQALQSSANLTLPMQESRELKNIRVFIISSDKGLCGAFNNGLNRYAEELIQKKWPNVAVEIATMGKKSHSYFRKRTNNQQIINHDGMATKPEYSAVQPIIAQCVADFAAKKIDGVYIIYNQFISMISQKPRSLQLLPLEFADPTGETTDMLFEPSAAELLNSLIPQYLSAQMYNCLLENQIGEHVARMTAMENATNNSQDLIDRYTLQMNRARQSAITTELTEIVAGAESLKG